MISFDTFRHNWERLHERVACACAKAGRKPESVKILPVTKSHPAAAVEYAVRAGAEAIGENRVQEAEAKRGEVKTPVRWELIGHLQSNKARTAAAVFDRVQSLDRAKLARKLDQAASAGNQPLSVLLQVNAGGDPAKFGCAPDEAARLLQAVLELPHLRVEGLMTIAPLADNPEIALRTFARLRTLRDDLARLSGLGLEELSMGMTGDLEEAIREGSTQIRVGTALFGGSQVSGFRS